MFIKKGFMVFIVLLLLLMGCSKAPVVNEDPKDPDPQDPIVEVAIRNVFNGYEIPVEQDYQAFSVMIENTAAARPHSGISLADIVYEISVDGWAISRFMAIFANEFPNKVGPVRSARVPFAQLQKEWKLPFAHYGSAETGQGNALAVLLEIGLPIRFDGHKGLNAEFYSRDNTRSAPHNAYFNAEKALVKIPELTYESRFEYDDESTVNDSSVNEVTLRYSGSNIIDYKFDGNTNNYLRSINGQPMMDAYINKQVSVTNIVVLHARHWDAESVRYVLVEFVGEGKAEFFVGGKYEEGTWKKSSETSITKFYDSVGDEIVLLPGNTWIQIVHPDIAISFETIEK